MIFLEFYSRVCRNSEHPKLNTSSLFKVFDNYKIQNKILNETLS